MSKAETTSENRGASAAAIRAHYDIANDFYRLWLDRGMSYSGAMWEPGDTLDVAQTRKVDYHIIQAQARQKDCVLDVGCGWGAVLQRMVETHGVRRAVGLTLSEEQAEWIRALNLSPVEVRLESWADHRPKQLYDGIISIGAFEHFARMESSDEEKVRAYRAFFERCSEWLKPPGRLSLQTFAYGGTNPRSHVQNTQGTRFLSSEIFQETDPPRLVDIAQAAEGLFEIVALRNDRRDYARTCREWQKRLRANRESASRLAGEEVVVRFDRYLQLATIGFQTGALALYRITLAPLRVNCE